MRPGQRIAVAVSGGADSVALLRRLLEQRGQLGIVLSVAHVHHGIRGAEADEDAAFVASLAAAHELPFHLHRTDAPAAAASLHESLEEAARNLRYAFLGELMANGSADAIATAHTLDDQAETVLHKLLRGAWTPGLSGIHAVVAAEHGSIVRPFLANRHLAITEWLLQLGQAWREDSSNQDMAHTRNRIRAQVLPLLGTFNPRISEQLARVAALAADDEDYWERELRRVVPALVLPGRPTRGGGRSSSTDPEQETIGIELARLRALHPALVRRVVRAAALQMGARLGFEHTERLVAMVAQGRAGKLELPGGIIVERSLREIRFSKGADGCLPAYTFTLPGELRAPEYGLHLQVELAAVAVHSGTPVSATLRPWKAGDRVTLRHSSSPKKVADVLDRLHAAGNPRKNWPVVEAEGEIVWMRGVEVYAPGYRVLPLSMTD